ncbi:contractile injection system protein, VgrG/Pvc8 family [Caballeronia sp. ATUFL_M2_KS44]|uniref:phage baseplate assembly protein V n=1 Tax=Caballeronia sp. ATUFL_M2_KS44 TaxID=2921767 RepID=UPI002027CCE4|nr:contractile injection system protein, VgrG/Pvc8 family [Caballeronia sp. ATUFL_M2_KS44]
MKAHPVLSALSLQVGGTDAPALWLARLADLRIVQRLGLPSVCELTFSDPDGRLGDTALTQAGGELQVSVGAPGDALFSGDISGLAYLYESGDGRQLRVRAYDRLGRLARRQKQRTFAQTSLLEVAGELVADLGIDVACDLPDVAIDHAIQHEQTDLRFLSDLAARNGLYAFLAGRTLRLVALRGARPAPDAVIEMAMGRELLEARFSRNDMAACASVSAHGWNSATAEVHRAMAEHGAAPGETSGFASATSLANRAFCDDAHAERHAQAEFDFHAARASGMAGVANGDPRLRPGARVAVEGVARALRGPYLLAAVSHTVSAESGYVSEIETTPQRPPSESRGTSLTLGSVFRTDDPQALGRVQLTLPALGEVTTDWVKTVSPWAGAGKGFMSQPDTGDIVLFAFFDADPAHGVVLGSVYGGAPPRDWSRSARGQCYALVTPGGQKIRFDDAGGSTHVEIANGSYIQLSPKETVIHACGALRIEAPGEALTLRARTIDLERA